MAVNHQDIIDATIRCAHRVGLPAVTINMIGKEVGILGQGLYNHFDSKEDILQACFEHCQNQIGSLFRGVEPDPDDDLETSAKKLWFKYFNYFVDHPAECAFYRHFRELNHPVHPVKEHDEPYLKDLWRILDSLDEKYGLFNNFSKKTFLYYVRNVTPYLARAISDGIKEDTAENRELMWLLAFNGLSLFSPGNN